MDNEFKKFGLIGGTDKEICKFLVGADMYLVIPFDDSEIVFCPIMDLWAMSDDRRNLTGKNMMVKGKPISKDDFINWEIDFEKIKYSTTLLLILWN